MAIWSWQGGGGRRRGFNLPNGTESQNQNIYASTFTIVWVLYMHAGFLVFSSEILLNLIFWQCSTFYNTYSTLHCLAKHPPILHYMILLKCCQYYLLKSWTDLGSGFFQFVLYRSFALFWLHCTGPCVQDGCLMLQYVLYSRVDWFVPFLTH